MYGIIIIIFIHRLLLLTSCSPLAAPSPRLASTPGILQGPRPPMATAAASTAATLRAARGKVRAESANIVMIPAKLC